MNWKILYRQHAPALYSFLLARGCGSHEAEDIIHEVFTAAMCAGTRVEQPKAYLFQAVRNAMGGRKTREITIPEIVHHAPDSEKTEGINRALSRLPKEQREVVVLRIWHEYGFREIGEALGVSKDTAASRWRYGIKKLKEVLHG